MIKIFKKIINKIKREGIGGLYNTVMRYFFPKKIYSLKQIKLKLCEKYGLEIGGPSSIFKDRNLIPIYSCISSLDNCNFAEQTVWEGTIIKGGTFQYDGNKSLGKQFVEEASQLTNIASSSYDFILSSHVLEHVANPLKALTEWKRILKPNGYLLLILPHKDGTFDHKRPTTTLKHLIEDHENNIDETDLTHLDEILELHDLTLDPEAGDIEKFKTRSKNNYENRCLHHHVFDTALAIDLINHMKLKIYVVEVLEPMHIMIFAQKVEPTSFSPQKPSYASPFKSDNDI